MNLPTDLFMGSSTPLSLEAVWLYFTRASLVASGVIITLLLGHRWLRRCVPPRWRVYLWLPVVVLLVLPAVPQPTLFRGISLPFTHWTQTQAEAPLSHDEFPVAPYFEGQLQPSRPPLIEDKSPPLGELFPAFPHEPIPDWPTSPAIDNTALLLQSLALVWAGGAVALLCWWLVGYCWLSRRWRQLQQVPPGWLQQVFYRCLAEMQLPPHRTPRLLITAGVDHPLVAGIGRASVLIPLHLVPRLSPGEWRHILLHELAHIRRRDLAWLWLGALVVALHWWNPLVWLAARRFRADAEAASDSLAIAACTDQAANDYGRTLLQALSLVSPPRRTWATIGLPGSVSLIRHRLEDITRAPGRSSPSTYGLILLGITAVSASMALLAGEPAPILPASPKMVDEALSRPLLFEDLLIPRSVQEPPLHLPDQSPPLPRKNALLGPSGQPAPGDEVHKATAIIYCQIQAPTEWEIFAPIAIQSLQSVSLRQQFHQAQPDLDDASLLIQAEPIPGSSQIRVTMTSRVRQNVRTALQAFLVEFQKQQTKNARIRALANGGDELMRNIQDQNRTLADLEKQLSELPLSQMSNRNLLITAIREATEKRQQLTDQMEQRLRVATAGNFALATTPDTVVPEEPKTPVKPKALTEPAPPQLTYKIEEERYKLFLKYRLLKTPNVAPVTATLSIRRVHYFDDDVPDAAHKKAYEVTTTFPTFKETSIVFISRDNPLFQVKEDDLGLPKWEDTDKRTRVKLKWRTEGDKFWIEIEAAEPAR